MRKTVELALVSVTLCSLSSCGSRTGESTGDGGRSRVEINPPMDARGDGGRLLDGGAVDGAGASLAKERDAASADGKPVAPTFGVGGTVAGLLGRGLVIRNGDGNGVVIAPGSTQFWFDERLSSGGGYAITVVRQPSQPTQTCAVVNGRGTIASADVTDVSITCSTDAFEVGGSVSGVLGQGLVLENQGVDDLSVAPEASHFAFTEKIPSGADFAVTVASQPASPSQTCVVSRGRGTIVDAPVSDVSLVCTTRSFPLGGTVDGLLGSGLVLTDGNGQTLSLPPAAATFTFARPLASGALYSIAVVAQPRSPAQLCTVAGGTGTVGDGPVATPSLACVTRSFAIGGTVAGLVGTGLVLRDNGEDDLAVPGPATAAAVTGPDASTGGDGTPFTFPKRIASANPFAVTVWAQPTTPAQTCVVSGGRGLVGDGDVASVVVNCTVASFTVGGRVIGLVGPLTLRNGLDAQTVTANGDFALPTPVPSGTAYDVRVTDSTGSIPPAQICSVKNGTGVVAGANVADVEIVCAPVSHRVNATVIGLAGKGLVLLDNGGDPIAVSGNGSITFAGEIASGAPYGVSIAAQPVGPSQTCVLLPGDPTGTAPPRGIIAAGDVTVSVACETNRYLVRPAVTGLIGEGLVLQRSSPDLPAEELSVSGNGVFNFATAAPDGSPFSIAVTRQPTSPWQTCTATPAAASLAGGDVIVDVTCTLDTFVLGGTVTGLSGEGLVLQNDGGDDLAIPPGATRFSFPHPLASGSRFDVRVKTPQPVSPWQTCTVAGGSGTMAGDAVDSVEIECVTNSYRVLLDVTNLQGSGLVLQSGGGDDLPVEEDGRVAFATPLASGQSYHVVIASQPSGPEQVCTVADADGVVEGEDVFLAVTCATRRFRVGGTVVGLSGGGLVLENAGADSLAVPAGSTGFNFPTEVPSGDVYFVTVAAQPAGQSCLPINDVGVVTDHDVDDVNVVCFSAVCASAPEGQTLSISCPPGQAIFDIAFASYGTPGGECGALTAGTCDAATAGDVVYEACLGFQSCTLPVNRDAFGDPCPGVKKTLRVQVSCL